MIPLFLQRINIDKGKKFFDFLPNIIVNSVRDHTYEALLYKVEKPARESHLKLIDEWMGRADTSWDESILLEILVVLDTLRYPDVALAEKLLSIDNMDVTRLSHWLHFTSLVYPIYSPMACKGLAKLGLETSWDPYDIASYGVYVMQIEGLIEYAHANALPELSLPRQRIIEIGLAQWAHVD